MSENIGIQSFSDDDSPFTMGPRNGGMKPYSEKTAQQIDGEVAERLAEYYNQAKELLLANREALEIMAKELLERETIDGFEVAEIVKFKRILSEEERVELHPEALQRGFNAKEEGEEDAAASSDVPDAGIPEAGDPDEIPPSFESPPEASPA